MAEAGKQLGSQRLTTEVNSACLRADWLMYSVRSTRWLPRPAALQLYI
jgi:hypothetical protein